MTTITLDIETSGTDWKKDNVHLIGYRLDRQGEITYVDPTLLDRPLFTLLGNSDNTLSGHGIKFDCLFLMRFGYVINCKLEDTRVMAYLQWPELESHSLKDLCETKLGKRPTELSDLLFKPLKRDLFILAERADEYAEIDDYLCRKDLLMSYHKEDILNVDRLRRLMYPSKWFIDIEMPLTRLLLDMEYFGCPLDIPYLETLNQQIGGRTKLLLYELKNDNEEFNPGSIPQVISKFKEQGVNLEKECSKTKGGSFSIDKQFLKRQSWKGSAFAKTLLEYRRLSKILGTYIVPFVGGSSSDGRLHGSINQAGSEDQYGEGRRGTNTGRLSSANPNLQNIPARTEEGKKVRKAFVASEGYLLCDSDLAQIEPRLVGHFSQSKKLIEAYAQNKDTHGMFGADIFKKPIEQLTKTERFIGKTSWLATTYGCSYKKLLLICESFSEDPIMLNLTEYMPLFSMLPISSKWGDSQKSLRKKYGEEANVLYAKWMFFKDVQDNFRKANPEIVGWAQTCVIRARQKEYVETMHGRKFALKDINAIEPRLRFAAERKAINTPIQASAAEIMKLIMLRFKNEFVDKKYGRVLSVVHDEVLLEAKKELGTTFVVNLVDDLMCNTVKLKNILIKAETKIIPSWGEK